MESCNKGGQWQGLPLDRCRATRYLRGMPDLLDTTTPTWDLICTMLRPGHSKYVRATLNARMAVLGAQDLFQLVAMEAVYNHREPLIRDRWDPAIIGSGLTLPEGPTVTGPLHLVWDELLQLWEAATMSPTGLDVFGYYPTVEEANAVYRSAVALPAARPTQVYVNGDPHLRTIVAGQIVPPLD